MKIYISMPITSNRQHCRERAEKVKAMLLRRGHQPVSPFDVCPEDGLLYATYIGRYIESLLQCDGVFLLTGWSNCTSCQIEWQAAQIFNKKIFTHISQIPTKDEKV